MKTKWYKLFVKMKCSALLFFRGPLLFTRGIIRLVCMQQKWGFKKRRVIQEKEREREKFPQTMILQILLHILSWSGIIHFLTQQIQNARKYICVPLLSQLLQARFPWVYLQNTTTNMFSCECSEYVSVCRICYYFNK